MRKKVYLNKGKPISLGISPNLYNKIDLIRKRFYEQNGFNISMIDAGNILASHIKSPRIPNLIKNDNKKR